MAHLAIRLLGSYQVTAAESPVTSFRWAKIGALLAYLVLESQRAHARCELVELLWPEQAQGTGLADLRQALFRLRRHLCEDGNPVPFLLITPNDIQFNRAADFWLDVAEFRTRIEAPHAHHHGEDRLCDHCVAALSEAVDLYRGPLLAGLGPEGSADFDDWLLTQQETLHEQALATLGHLTTHLLRLGDHSLASHYAQRAIELDPPHELAHRQRMLALAMSGRTAEALRQYRRLQRILAHDSGLEPSLRTTRLYERILAGTPLEGFEGEPGQGAGIPASPRPLVPVVSASRRASYRAVLTDYRLKRIAEWSQRKFRVDGRFVELTMLVDSGQDVAGDRWAASPQRYMDLRALLAAIADPAVVVLGPPGSGKSTLLRHVELDTAMANLRGDDHRGTVTFYIQLNQYKARSGRPAPDPGDWLAERWSARYPALPALDDLLAQGCMVLLLDALNEIPATSESAFRECVVLWRGWLNRLAAERPGNRVVFSCRTLDYSAPLSTPALRVPQVRIEPLSDDQVHAFLRVSSPVKAEAAWLAIAGTPELEVLRVPFYLALLSDHVAATGEVAPDRAGLLTGFVRRALKREVERGNPLFSQEALLSRRDMRRIALDSWRGAHELPERGALVTSLSGLAHGMQASAADGEGSQVRVSYDKALELLAHERRDQILRAGLALGVLDEDPAAEEVMYRHQLVQEYFAARILAARPNPDLVRAEWLAKQVSPPVDEVIDALTPAESVPALPRTGWEETTLLAATMTSDVQAFVLGLAATNLVLAGVAAAQAEVRGRLPEALVDDLRWALVNRSRDPDADLRHRIACGRAVGDLGDPRFERRTGPAGAYLMPPLTEVPRGLYPIGDDEPIEWPLGERGSDSSLTHVPRHQVAIDGFLVGRFPVTNAEWACFIDADGYDDDNWWDTADAARWRRGELVNDARKYNNRWWRRRFLADPTLLESMVADGSFANEAMIERWRDWMTLDEPAFERALDAHWRPKRRAEPMFWRDERFNHASQPVVGICWYEARAYCRWMSCQTGLSVRLPTEAQWEAAARGLEGRSYPWGSGFDRLSANTRETYLRRTTPIGVFPTGDTPAGVTDLAGNVFDWTTSLWGLHAGDEAQVEFGYPYDAGDGRENPLASPCVARVSRGGSWYRPHANARVAYRGNNLPDEASHSNGLRLVVSPE